MNSNTYEKMEKWRDNSHCDKCIISEILYDGEIQDHYNLYTLLTIVTREKKSSK